MSTHNICFRQEIRKISAFFGCEKQMFKLAIAFLHMQLNDHGSFFFLGCCLMVEA